jgi:nitrite reductase/ring-hydroxylating ferredoxin subunit
MPHIDLAVEDLAIDTPMRFEHDGTTIVVIRTSQGIAAFADRCPHAHWPLSAGELVDGRLECPGHGWQFDPMTGNCLTSPAYQLTPYTVVVLHGGVRIAWD